jgi:hypothetical protein
MSELIPQIITGLPAGEKVKPRVDFQPTEFDKAIVTKGYRMWWSRAGICPCRNNDQTDQPSPICPLCKGKAYYYFLPDPAIASGAVKDSEGNEAVVNEAGDALLIYVLMTSFTQDTQIFEKFGEWVFGTSRASTQPQNRLGYKDRLVNVDSEMVWAQHIEYDGSSEIVVTGEEKESGLRYPFLSVHQLRSISTVYRQGTDFAVTDDGTIEWLAIGSSPDADTLLSIHGTVHPTWIVIDHANIFRDTHLEGVSSAISAQKHKKLPMQVACKLDFLISP